jgi:hypothetical protein
MHFSSFLSLWGGVGHPRIQQASWELTSALNHRLQESPCCQDFLSVSFPAFLHPTNLGSPFSFTQLLGVQGSRWETVGSATPSAGETQSEDSLKVNTISPIREDSEQLVLETHDERLLGL